MNSAQQTNQTESATRPILLPANTRQHSMNAGKIRNMVDRHVEELFFRIHDRENPLHRKAYEQHVRTHQKSLRVKRSAVCVVRISDPHVLRCIIKHRVLDACENLAILEREAAQARLEESRQHIITRLGLRTGHFLNGDESIDVDRLQVVKKNRAEEVGDLKSLLGFCQQLSRGETSVPVEDICNGVVPPEFERRPDFKAFLSDLALLFVNEGDTARKVVARVCEEEPFARKLAEDEGVPRPLRYLASIAVKVRGLSTQKQVKANGVGFGASSEA